jgi:hypothetical protein
MWDTFRRGSGASSRIGWDRMPEWRRMKVEESAGKPPMPTHHNTGAS